MSDRLNAQSTVLEAKKYVLFYKYLSFDEDFGPNGEQLLMEAGKVLDSLSESESIPKIYLTVLWRNLEMSTIE